MVFIFSLMKKRTKKSRLRWHRLPALQPPLKFSKLAPFGRSDNENFGRCGFHSGRDADPSEAGRLEGWRTAGPDHVFKEMV
jgi:hypothetical protein